MKLQVIWEPTDPAPNEEGHRTLEEMVGVYERLLQMQVRKGRMYGPTWREQGYMGNVARVLGKVSRLRNMVWRDVQVNDSDETVEDTLGDMINIAAFALINIREGNKWGDVRH